MPILIAGGTGLLGSSLARALRARGHAITVPTRRVDRARQRAGPGDGLTFVPWPGHHDTSWTPLVETHEVIVNLVGESIAGGRWTAARKARLRDSRVGPTRAIARAIAAAPTPPRLLVSASAVGYYGSRGDEVLTETSAPGDDFLATLAVDWEQAALDVADAATGVALVRTGVVLSRRDGVLARLLLPFRLGLGGRVGSGRQYMSWVHEDDWVSLVCEVVTRGHQGVMNATAPTPVTNAVFARELGRALNRPAILPAPAFALRLALGEMADALLLSSQRAVPQRALELGFAFAYPTIREAFSHLVGGRG
jgi:hypothetical protein